MVQGIRHPMRWLSGARTFRCRLRGPDKRRGCRFRFRGGWVQSVRRRHVSREMRAGRLGRVRPTKVFFDFFKEGFGRLDKKKRGPGGGVVSGGTKFGGDFFLFGKGLKKKKMF